MSEPGSLWLELTYLSFITLYISHTTTKRDRPMIRFFRNVGICSFTIEHILKWKIVYDIKSEIVNHNLFIDWLLFNAKRVVFHFDLKLCRFPLKLKKVACPIQDVVAPHCDKCYLSDYFFMSSWYWNTGFDRSITNWDRRGRRAVGFTTTCANINYL
jgi:hypothetical protein